MKLGESYVLAEMMIKIYFCIKHNELFFCHNLYMNP